MRNETKTIKSVLYKISFIWIFLILFCCFAVTVNADGPDNLTIPDLQPWVTAGEKDISFTIAKPENSEKLEVNVWYEGEGFEEENTKLFQKESTTGDIEVNIPKDSLRAGMFVFVNAKSWDNDNNETRTEKNFAVIGTTSDDISVAVSKNAVKVNERFTVTVTPKDALAMTEVQLYDSFELYDEGEPDDNGSFIRDMDYGEPGTFAIYARARIGESNEWITSEPVVVTVTSDGSVGAVTFTMSNTEAKRGETLTGTFKPSDHADMYWVKALTYDEESQEWVRFRHLGAWNKTAAEAFEVSFNTIELPEGKYRIIAGASGIGYEGRETWEASELIITITKPQQIPESGVLFNASKTTLVTMERYTLSAYCPEAKKLELYWYNVNDPNENNEDDPEVFEDTDSFIMEDEWRSSGKYEVFVRAYKDDSESYSESDKITITVTAPNGPLSITRPKALPSYVKTGENINFTVKKPANASELNVRAWDDSDEENDTPLFREESESDEISVNISKEKLKEGMIVTISAEAWGPGYNPDPQEWKIPVIAAPNNALQISIKNKTQDQLKNVLVNEQLEVCVEAVNMSKVQFFDGEDFWDPEDPDEDGKFTREIDFAEPGTFAIYARARIGESDDWITSEPVVITTTSNGPVGNFTFTMTDTEAVRGESLSGTFTESEHADTYWLKAVIDGDDEREWYLGDWDTAGDVSFNTMELPAGEYRIIAGAKAEGYTRYETWNQEALMITIADVNPPESGVLFNVNPNSVQTHEDFSLSAYAPDAERIEVFSRQIEGGNGSWSDEWYGDSFSDRHSFGNAGKYELFARAYFQDDSGQETSKDSDPVTITVTAPKGDLSLDLSGIPASWSTVSGADPLSFTVEKPENAAGLDVRVCYDTENGEKDLFNQEDGEDNVEVSIQKSKIPQDQDCLKVQVYAWGPGYNGVWKEHRIALYGETSNDVTVSVDENTVPVNKNITVTVAADNMTEVQLYDGYRFWNPENPDEDDKFTRSIDFGEPGVFAIYARARIGKSNEWITSAPVNVTVTSQGRVGAFTFTMNKKAATKGTTILGGFTTSAHASNYWYDVEKYNEDKHDWNFINSYDANSNHEIISLDTADLDPGNYRIIAKANAEGYEEYNTYNNPWTFVVAAPISRGIQVNWNDDSNKLNMRADIQATICNKNNETVVLGQVMLEDSKDWTDTVSNLDKYNADGTEAEYIWKFATPCKCYTSDEGTYNEENGLTTFTLTLKHDLVKTNAKDPTADAEGNIEYYTCKDCNKIFSDAGGKNEITLANTVIPRLSSVQVVEAMLNALPASVGLNDAAKVEQARKAYDALGADKDKISAEAVNKLTTAEGQISAARNSAADQAAVNAAIARINALPAQITTANEAAVNAARAAYDALTPAQKALVSGTVKSKLTT
ncbi:MAG: Cna B-type domain-containing protein, partial [Eubacterium sp.]|nr:Cna B-type domain-containing protein [Eubacterium sp.]